MKRGMQTASLNHGLHRRGAPFLISREAGHASLSVVTLSKLSSPPGAWIIPKTEPIKARDEVPRSHSGMRLSGVWKASPKIENGRKEKVV